MKVPPWFTGNCQKLALSSYTSLGKHTDIAALRSGCQDLPLYVIDTARLSPNEWTIRQYPG